MRLNLSKNKICEVLLFLLFLTSSFDIFFNIHINSFTLRGVYFIEFILFVYIIVEYFTNNIKLKLTAYKYLFIWVLFIILFIFNTNVLIRNIGYVFWLLLSVLLILIISSVIDSKYKWQNVFDLYINSFKYIALFGIFQFILGLFGIDILVMQHFLPYLVRVNGFSYEPSYFASYMLIGWLILIYIYRYNRNLFIKYKFDFYFITLALILSTSRMSILVMFLAFFSLSFISTVKSFKKLKILKKDIKIIIFLFMFVISLVVVFISYWQELKFLLDGISLFGESSHSISPRINGMIETFIVFLNSPIIGYSLGGIPSAIAQNQGIYISTQAEAKTFEGVNIFLEVLAASGIIGYLFFLFFLFLLFYKSGKIAKKIKYVFFDNYIIIKSLRFALFWELFILSLNQNILRPYLWILIGMLSSSIIIGRKILYETKINNRL